MSGVESLLVGLLAIDGLVEIRRLGVGRKLK